MLRFDAVDRPQIVQRYRTMTPGVHVGPSTPIGEDVDRHI